MVPVIKATKGILLAGGSASRMRPISFGVSKQLLPVYDKPAIYYPLTTLMLAGIREVLIISTPIDLIALKRVLGDGSQWGLNLSYEQQVSPKGVAEAYVIGEEFLGDSDSILILGDNLFHGPGLGRQLARLNSPKGAKLNAYSVSDPTSFGVVELDHDGKIISIEEKPKKPRSNLAITGLYAFDSTATARARELSPSDRGELEITDLILSYHRDSELSVDLLPRGTAWLDFGTPEALLESSQYVRTLQNRQGTLIGSPDEAALILGLINVDLYVKLAEKCLPSDYGKLLIHGLEKKGWFES
jgi:glucose-1-phosphate thymidylyltransferase